VLRTCPPPGGATPITDYRALKRALVELPPPGANHARVFRGQTRDFGKMLPTGLRGTPLRSEHIFRAYTTLLASDVGSPGADAENLLLWTRVIAQHYGPGSTLLDVTYSVDVALWFALHSLRAVQSQHLFGPPGPFNPQTDTVGSAEVMIYEPVDTGVLFVLDVPLAKVKRAFEHGVLIDAADAPTVFASSPRVRAQQACLIRATSRQARTSPSSTPAPRLRWAVRCRVARWLPSPRRGCFPRRRMTRGMRSSPAFPGAGDWTGTALRWRSSRRSP
jgi:hypothetical protein